MDVANLEEATGIYLKGYNCHAIRGENQII